MMKKQYTEEETKAFIEARNAKTKADRLRLKGELVWNSAKGQQGTFRGSVRKEFLGVKRDNKIED